VRLARTLTAAVLVVLAGSANPVFAADSVVPAGFRVVGHSTVTTGVERFELVREEPPLVVHVARLAPDAPVSVRAVLSNDAVAGDDPIVERTSTMCARVHCLLAVNGDFAGADNQPLGGLLTGGELLRTPSPTQLQLSVGKDGRLSAGELSWTGTLLPTDLEPLTLGGVNVSAGPDVVTLYTAAYGARVETPEPTTVLSFRNVEPAGPLSVGQTTMVEITGQSEQAAGVEPSPIPADGGVLAGRGVAAEALRSLWQRIQGGVVSSRALLRLDTQAGVAESIGGSPILVRDGARWFADAANDFTRGRQPRTLVGWNPAGERFFVTVDGRQPETSVGMTLAEAADLLLALGATDGINLDGGGSTTFVAGGAVVNTPSDVAVRRGDGEAIQHLAAPGQQVIGHVERPVTSALVVVGKNEVSVPPVPASTGAASGLSQALELAVRSSTDPGSVPVGAVPPLVAGPEVGLGPALRLAAVVADVVVATALAALAIRRRRRSRPDRLSTEPSSRAALAA
jgi:hypothetical protein